ncbi:MAG: A/G-specific adenine glycosylase [Mariniblastus sp.]|nr:A/G-specific adenine glycosylase [Mariniblastus sp.]
MTELLNQFPDATCLESRSGFQRKLLKWFDRNQRDLPWRRNRNRYRVWVSEIMLQQTQVTTVIDYYRRFIQRFPNVKTLAQADVEDVLKQWEGLGYYRRARQMHAAARVIMETHKGRFPRDYQAVLQLPGIGRYTAGAILSIADDLPLPILEGNTIRLFSRLLLLHSDPRSSRNQKWLWEFAETLLPSQRTGDFNQALMELGALICTPNAPDCLHCPVQFCCPAFAQGKQGEIPVRVRKINYLETNEAVVLVSRKRRFLVRKCLPDERWAGLWDFPRYSLDDTPSGERQRCGALQKQLQQDYGLQTTVAAMDQEIRHAVTRFRITLSCYQALDVRGRLKKDRRESCWVSPDEIRELPLSATGRKIAERLIRQDG